jgi:DNA-binding MarR family transcriptional regulator
MFERCLYFNINALARRVNKIWEQAFDELGLSPAHAYLLRLVLDQPGISQGRIAEELKLEKSTVTRFVDSLQQRDYLNRIKSGREVEIMPTLKCRKIARQLQASGDALYKEMTGLIGKRNLADLVKQLRSDELK